MLEYIEYIGSITAASTIVIITASTISITGSKIEIIRLMAFSDSVL